MLRREAKALGLKTYRSEKSCPVGHASDRWTSSGRCLACWRDDHPRKAARQREWVRANSDLKAELDADYYLRNKEKVKERSRCWSVANRQRKANNDRRYRLLHLSKIEAYQRAWKARHSEKLSAYRKARQVRVERATPWWLSTEDRRRILTFYEDCPSGYEVDHIVPIAGRTVCGLHVPWNLQYLTISDNRSKSNKLQLVDVSPSV